uniref:Uncharacterized protein n=1 Tax=Knipowitschia caucasica TaxID=637954 RepID=A0AAV2LRD4_KNICA
MNDRSHISKSLISQSDISVFTFEDLVPVASVSSRKNQDRFQTRKCHRKIVKTEERSKAAVLEPLLEPPLEPPLEPLLEPPLEPPLEPLLEPLLCRRRYMFIMDLFLCLF